MSFPHLYKLQLEVGQYIPDEYIDDYVSRILSRINSLLATERQNLISFVINKPLETFPVLDGNINLRLARTITFTLPLGTTTLEFDNIKISTKDLIDNFIYIERTEGVLDQQQLTLGGLERYVTPGNVYDGETTIGWHNGIWFIWGGYPGYQKELPVAQTFTAGKTGILTKIILSIGLLRISGFLNVSIQTTNEQGKPTGIILENIVFPLPWITPVWEGAGEQTLYCNGETHLISGAKYAIVIDATHVTHAYGGMVLYYALPSEVDNYTRGELLIFSDGIWTTTKNSTYVIPEGNTQTNRDGWNNTDNLDLYFKTYILED